MKDNNCPICHGHGKVWYGICSESLTEPIPCRACDATGIRLWPAPGPDEIHDWAVYRICGPKRPQNPKQRTITALRHGRYREYRHACAEAGYAPLDNEAWRRTRTLYRTHPEYVRGRRGPR